MMFKRKFSYFSAILAFLIIFVSCGNVPRTESALIAYLDELGHEYELICVEMGTQNWNLYSKEAEADQDAPKFKYAELLLEPVHLKVVESWLDRMDEIGEPRLVRRLSVWSNVLNAARVDMDEDVFKLENRLEMEINEYAYDIDGQKVLHNELRRFLTQKDMDPEERNALYESYADKMQEEFEPRVLQLMRLRNEKAREIGYNDYGEMSLHMTELLADDSQWFYDMLDLIEKKTRKPFEELVEYGVEKTGKDLTIENLREICASGNKDLGSHKGYSRDDALKLAKETAVNIGIDIDSLPIRVVEQAIPYGGLNLAIQIPSDIRILVRPNSGSVGLFLHEFGHGLEAVFNETPEPIFKNYEWCLGASIPSYEEGMANVMSRFARHENWQKKYNHKSLTRMEMEKENENRLAPYTIRATIANFLYEYELYRNLERDPEEVARKLFKKWLLIDSGSHPRKHWATSIFPVAYPCYYQNYFISNIIAWQVHEFLRSEFGDDYLFNKKVGEWVIEHLFKVGHDLPWMEKIEKATGQKLDIAGYLASFGIV